MSPNGTLMAYSKPVDIKELRDQAALISMAWKEEEKSREKNDGAAEEIRPLETLTIETQHNNIIVRAIQSSLLLVLVGGVPPLRKKSVFRITPEGKGDARYPEMHPDATNESQRPATPAEDGSSGDADTARAKKAPSITSTMSVRVKDVKMGVLHIQRKKLDALTDFIRKDFDAKGFVMPDDSGFP
jgi:hypothetical protein